RKSQRGIVLVPLRRVDSRAGDGHECRSKDSGAEKAPIAPHISRSAASGFAPTRETHPILESCRRRDSIPVAIRWLEGAAPRPSVLRQIRGTMSAIRPNL